MFVSVHDVVHYITMQACICVRNSASLRGQTNVCTVNQRSQRQNLVFLKRGADEEALDRDVKARANIVEYREVREGKT